MFITKLCIAQCVILLCSDLIHCDIQIGPDPWDLEVNDKFNQIQSELDIPPDLRAIPEKKLSVKNTAGASDWFYKRMLAIILKAGQVKKKEDGTVFVSLEMKFDKARWLLLEEYTAINFALTEDMIRRSMGYVEEAIYKPTIIEKAAVAWTEYIQWYLVEYKVEITWTFGVLAVLTAGLWLWKHISHTHILVMLFIMFYLYEVFTSYKEAEKEELQRFLSAVNSCKWHIWSSNCDIPPPDPLIFIKYMNPLKIGIRMFTTVITEPMICINEAATTLVHGMTENLWFPLNKILYGILLLNFNILFVLFLIMIVFNYILNIPFNFSYLGLLNIGLKQRNRTFNSEVPQTSFNDSTDRISGATLNRLLDVCSRALSTAETKQNSQNKSNRKLPLTDITSTCKMRRSASTGRLPNSCEEFSHFQIEDSHVLNKGSRKFNKSPKHNGSGDGF